jgi:hypothetical protein
LCSLSPERLFWDFSLPEEIPDNFITEFMRDRRKSPRLKCSVSTEIHVDRQPTIWGKATDLSLGGCFVEMPGPLAVGTRLRIALWLASKVYLEGIVVSATPGYGIGIGFGKRSVSDLHALKTFLLTLEKPRSFNSSASDKGEKTALPK